jgi:hypothetical protein
MPGEEDDGSLVIWLATMLEYIFALFVLMLGLVCLMWLASTFIEERVHLAGRLGQIITVFALITSAFQFGAPRIHSIWSAVAMTTANGTWLVLYWVAGFPLRRSVGLGILMVAGIIAVCLSQFVVSLDMLSLTEEGGLSLYFISVFAFCIWLLPVLVLATLCVFDSFAPSRDHSSAGPSAFQEWFNKVRGFFGRSRNED